jgi:hypothetical protein
MMTASDTIHLKGIGNAEYQFLLAIAKLLEHAFVQSLENQKKL